MRFHHQHVASPQMIANAERNVSQIRSNSDLDAFRAKREADWIGRIVRDCERLYCNVAHLKAVSRFEALEFFQPWFLALLIAHRARPRLMRCPRHKDRNSQLLCQRG